MSEFDEWNKADSDDSDPEPEFRVATVVPLKAVGSGHAALLMRDGYKCLRCGAIQSPEFMETTTCPQAPR